MFKKKSILASYIKENRLNIAILIILLVVGGIIGICVANSVNDNIKTELLQYMDNANKAIFNDIYVVNNYDIIKNTIINTTLYIGAILILGCSIVFAPLIYLVIIHKGFSIGFCLSFLIMLLGNVKGNIYALISILLPNIVLIAGIIYVSIIWMTFGRNILKNRELYGLKTKIYTCIIVTGIAYSILLGILIPIELFTNNILDNYIRIL